MSSYAIANRLTEHTWEAVCHQCGEVIGTMSGDTLLRAILHNVHRGGVMCVSCREKSCKQCMSLALSKDQLNSDGLCWFCAADMDCGDVEEGRLTIALV